MSITSTAGTRILSLLDEGSFVEIGSKITAKATDINKEPKQMPSDGCITGYGLINDCPVYVFSQDVSVLGGSIGEMHAKKIKRVYELALKTAVPVIGIFDSCGFRLNEAAESLSAFGEVYASMAKASGIIPQIGLCLGECGGAMSILSDLCDFTLMSDKAKKFVNAPNAIDGNNDKKCDTASCDFRKTECGEVDFAGTEDEVLAFARKLVSFIPANNIDEAAFVECNDDLNRVCENIDAYGTDAVSILSQIADDNDFVELKKDYEKSMVTGFLHLDGMLIGAIANASEKGDAVLTAKGCEKAADFVAYCDAYEIPILTLTNVTGYCNCMCNEKKVSKAAAKMSYAFADSTVAKVNVITGKAYGSAYVAMNSKSLGCDFTFAYPDSKIAMMDAKMAGKLLGSTPDEVAACEKDFLEKSTSEAAAKCGLVDEIVEPAEIRKYLIGAFEMLISKREEVPFKKHGTV